MFRENLINSLRPKQASHTAKVKKSIIKITLVNWVEITKKFISIKNSNVRRIIMRFFDSKKSFMLRENHTINIIRRKNLFENKNREIVKERSK